MRFYYKLVFAMEMQIGWWRELIGATEIKKASILSPV